MFEVYRREEQLLQNVELVDGDDEQNDEDDNDGDEDWQREQTTNTGPTTRRAGAREGVIDSTATPPLLALASTVLGWLGKTM